MLKRNLSWSLAAGILALAACAATGPETLENGAAEQSSFETLKVKAEGLDARLIERDARLRPVIGTSRRLSTDEVRVVSNFIELMPNGMHIVEGRPNYRLDIRKSADRQPGKPSDVRMVTYSLTLRLRSGREIVAESSQSGLCMRSEAGFVFPTRCSLMEPLILQRALEKL